MENQHKDMIGLRNNGTGLIIPKKPTNYARRKPMEQTKQEQFIIRRIGGTTYKVRVASSLNSGGDHGGKDSAMIRNEGLQTTALVL